MSDAAASSDWQRLLAAQRRLQALVPDAVLVGGSAAVLHLHHRQSFDGDHVLADLRDHFDETLARLEASPGWRTSRTQPPVLILGSLDGVPTGLRQLRRARPLETTVLEGLRAPSLLETARIKAWMLLERNTVRDYVDVVALLERLLEASLPEFARTFGTCYERGPKGGSSIVELVEKLGAAMPDDRNQVDLATYKDVCPPWNDIEAVRSRGRDLARKLAAVAMRNPGTGGGQR
jgi:hypothetical protein